MASMRLSQMTSLLFLYEGTILTEDSYEIMKVKKDPEDDRCINCAVEGERPKLIRWEVAKMEQGV